MSLFSKKISQLCRTTRLLVVVGGARDMASSAEAKPERINKNLSFRPAFDSRIDADVRPLVLLYGWLVAKSRHIHKYGDFYLGKGFDVLHIKIEPQQLLWPRKAQVVVEEIVKFAGQSTRQQQPILVHGFSVGGYLYGETLVSILSNPYYEGVGKRIQGQVFDSPVDFQGIPHGVGMAVTKVPALQKTIQFTLESYLNIFKNQTTKHFLRASQEFYDNKLRVPSLLLYSTADPVGEAGPINKVRRGWEAQGVPTYAKCWDDSRHVSHFHTHPVEYIRLLNTFLCNIGLVREQDAAISKQTSNS